MIELDPKVLVSLISVAFGWLLAQGSTFTRDWWQARKLTDGLFEELCDLDDQLERVQLIHARQLQIFALKGIEPTASLPLQNMFFKQHFKDAFSHLNRSQRQSYQLIHSLVENLNEREKGLKEFVFDVERTHRVSPTEEATRAAVQEFGAQVKQIYKGVRELQWHIAYHRLHPNVPRLDINSPMHETFVRFVSDLDAEVASTLETAGKQLLRKDFDRSVGPRSPQSAPSQPGQ